MLSARYSLSSFPFELLLLLLCMCLLSRLNWFAFLQRKSVCFFCYSLSWFEYRANGHGVVSHCEIYLSFPVVLFGIDMGCSTFTFFPLHPSFRLFSQIISMKWGEREINTYRGWVVIVLFCIVNLFLLWR